MKKFPAMPRKPLIRSRELPYHITARCNNKEHFPLPMYDVWTIISKELREIVDDYGSAIHAFVLMPNHFHLMMSTGNEDLGVIMQKLMLLITKKINAHSGRTGRIFGGRYHGSLIQDESYLDCALKYVYRNPVKAGLSETVESYPFSTIRFLIHQQAGAIPLSPPIGHSHLIPNQDIVGFINWMNQPFSNEEDQSIRGALKKIRFEPPKAGWRQTKTALHSSYRSLK
jgi:putative transposase